MGIFSSCFPSQQAPVSSYDPKTRWATEATSLGANIVHAVDEPETPSPLMDVKVKCRSKFPPVELQLQFERKDGIYYYHCSSQTSESVATVIREKLNEEINHTVVCYLDPPTAKWCYSELKFWKTEEDKILYSVPVWVEEMTGEGIASRIKIPVMMIPTGYDDGSLDLYACDGSDKGWLRRKRVEFFFTDMSPEESKEYMQRCFRMKVKPVSDEAADKQLDDLIKGEGPAPSPKDLPLRTENGPDR
jgi:hypothetical protein